MPKIGGTKRRQLPVSLEANKKRRRSQIAAEASEPAAEGGAVLKTVEVAASFWRKRFLRYSFLDAQFSVDGALPAGSASSRSTSSATR